MKIASARQLQPGIVSTLDAQRIPFSQAAFIQNLVMFVAANDQVRWTFIKLAYFLTLQLSCSQ